MMARATYEPGKTALVVHPGMGPLSAFQAALATAGFTTIVARDLPTAMLAITHHYFEVAIVSSRVAEEGDGWALGGVIRQAFPSAFVAVIAPGTSVIDYQAAINNGLSEIYDRNRPPEEIVAEVAARVLPGPAPDAAKDRKPTLQ
jgi:DNA-binding NtrC family response regulator